MSGEQQDGAAGRGHGLLCRATGMHDGARHYCTLNTAPHQVHQCGDCGHVWTDSGEEFEAVLAERDALAARVVELEAELLRMEEQRDLVHYQLTGAQARLDYLEGRSSR